MHHFFFMFMIGNIKPLKSNSESHGWKLTKMTLLLLGMRIFYTTPIKIIF